MTDNPVKLVESPYSPHFTFKAIAPNSDPHTEEDIFALRYQVYCLERSFLRAEDYPNGLESDAYDPYSAHIIAYSMAGQMVGGLRLVTPPDDMPFPYQVHCDKLFTDRTFPPNHDCAEISRLVISKLYRRRAGDTVFGVAAQLLEESPAPAGTYDRRKAQRGEGNDRRKLQPEILLGLLRKAYQYCKTHDIGFWYMAMERPLARLLERMFYFSLEPIGEQVDYYGPVTPSILSMKHFDHALSRGDPILFAWFNDEIEV